MVEVGLVSECWTEIFYYQKVFFDIAVIWMLFRKVPNYITKAV